MFLFPLNRFIAFYELISITAFMDSNAGSTEMRISGAWRSHTLNSGSWYESKTKHKSHCNCSYNSFSIFAVIALSKIAINFNMRSFSTRMMWKMFPLKIQKWWSEISFLLHQFKRMRREQTTKQQKKGWL